MAGHGFIIAAPQSGSGKTTITLGLLRALKRSGLTLRSFKAGPDFIDPAFHTAASGTPCINLDPWAMRSDLIQSLVGSNDDLVVVEAMMGLFDGAADGTGSAADLAQMLDLPIVLVVDAAKQSHSIAALVSGFINFRSGLTVAGVILNRVGSERHGDMLCEALSGIGVTVLGMVYRDTKLELPSRHLGLVQAGEHVDLDVFLESAADVMNASLDLPKLQTLKRGSISSRSAHSLKPMGQRIAVASDAAFAFAYPHLLQGWQEQGAEIFPFSPLDNEAPADHCDSIYLPGGYPELYGSRLAANCGFLDGLRHKADQGCFIFGECGGYMVLGEALIDKDGHGHEMANLLPLITSFEKRKLHLGYRTAQGLSNLPFLPQGNFVRAHEFHYSSVIKEEGADSLFRIKDARGTELGVCGLRSGTVAGSYMHLIDREDMS